MGSLSELIADDEAMKMVVGAPRRRIGGNTEPASRLS